MECPTDIPADGRFGDFAGKHKSAFLFFFLHRSFADQLHDFLGTFVADRCRVVLP